MRVNLTQHAGVRFAVFSEDQCEQIALAAFEVLERVGDRIRERVRMLLEEHRAHPLGGEIIAQLDRIVRV